MELGTNFTGVDQSTCQMVYACVRQYRAAVRTIIMGSFHKAAETWNYNPLPIHQQKLIAAYYRVYELFPDHVNGCFRDWYQWTEGRGRTRTAETFPDLEMIYQVKSNP